MIIDKKEHWKVELNGDKITVDLYSLVFTEKEVMKILDAYKKAVDIRHYEISRGGEKGTVL